MIRHGIVIGVLPADADVSHRNIRLCNVLFDLLYDRLLPDRRLRRRLNRLVLVLPGLEILVQQQFDLLLAHVSDHGDDRIVRDCSVLHGNR